LKDTQTQNQDPKIEKSKETTEKKENINLADLDFIKSPLI
jgi:hypothetical protein